MRLPYSAFFIAFCLLFSGCIAPTPAPPQELPQAPQSPSLQPSAQNDSLIVEIENGQLRGTEHNGVRAYLGIPYAAPPVGELRWKPPQPAASWSGVKDATAFGPPCPQNLSNQFTVDETVKTTSEDCLFLNVWAPAKSTEGLLPIMVWIHGGAFVQGSGSTSEYNGENLAEKGVVIVNMNYRLGPYGFLAHPELAEESAHNVSGNYGLLDQIAAFEWVKRNIHAFGGDPGKITIFGESAGSISVSSHLLSPLSKGLFKGAICESGTIFTDKHALPDWNYTIEGAEKIGIQYAADLGCDKAGDAAACLRSKTTKELYDATLGKSEFSPVLDGWFFPDYPEAVLAEGKQNDVPLIIGYNANEGTIFTDTPDEATEYAKKAFLIPELMFARQMKSSVFFYEFTRVPQTKLARMFGAYHSIEIPYVFGNFGTEDGYGQTDFALSGKMMDYWANFAKTGNPNGQDLPEWAEFDEQTGSYLELGNATVAKTGMGKK